MSIRLHAARALRLCALALLSQAASAMALEGDRLPVEATPAVPLHALPNLEQIIPTLSRHRVVFVGETHSRFDHHRIQLEILRRLAEHEPRLLLGVEWFQQPFQEVLDEYLSGAIDERALLQRSEYYQRWRFDFRHYAPILRFARERCIPVIALNLPAEVTRAAARRDLSEIDPALRQWIPQEIDRGDGAYRRRLEEAFEAHPPREDSDFERFYTTQLLWDEGMAERATRALDEHPEHRLVVFAGSGHLAFRSGIPNRLQRRSGERGAIVLPSWDGPVQVGLADFMLLSQPDSLPEPGLLGVALEPGEGRLTIDDVAPDSAAAAAGLDKGDVLVRIDDIPVADIADVRTALWDRAPGDTVTVTVRRGHLLGDERTISVDAVLR